MMTWELLGWQAFTRILAMVYDSIHYLVIPLASQAISAHTLPQAWILLYKHDVKYLVRLIRFGKNAADEGLQLHFYS